MASNPRVLIIGAGGYVGKNLVAQLSDHGSRSVQVTAMVRPSSSTLPGAVPVSDASAFDRLIDDGGFDQIVCLAQLTRPDVDWLVDRIDGSRWLLFSSAQLLSSTPAPQTEVALARQQAALARGAVILSPTMIFGRGGDANVSRFARLMRSSRVPFYPGDGRQLVQPVHVDDVIALVRCHLLEGAPSGIYPVGGAEAVPVAELVGSLAEILGVRMPPLSIPSKLLRGGGVLGPLVGLRSDQVLRMIEDKTVDDTLTRATFGWEPRPLAHRLEQAVSELAEPVRR